MRSSLHICLESCPDVPLVVLTLLVVAGTSLPTLAQSQTQTPRPASSRADETLERWNDIGNKLVAMAQDFPKTSTITSSRKTSALSP